MKHGLGNEGDDRTATIAQGDTIEAPSGKVTVCLPVCFKAHTSKIFKFWIWDNTHIHHFVLLS
jgi:hypothetical protein